MAVFAMFHLRMGRDDGFLSINQLQSKAIQNHWTINISHNNTSSVFPVANLSTMKVTSGKLSFQVKYCSNSTDVSVELDTHASSKLNSEDQNKGIIVISKLNWFTILTPIRTHFSGLILMPRKLY